MLNALWDNCRHFHWKRIAHVLFIREKKRINSVEKVFGENLAWKQNKFDIGGRVNEIYK